MSKETLISKYQDIVNQFDIDATDLRAAIYDEKATRIVQRTLVPKLDEIKLQKMMYETFVRELQTL